MLLGKAVQTLSGKGYRETFYEKGLEVIHEALNQLGQEFEVLVLEGAGSPVEMNLKDRELVNMKIAEMADIPVFLVADIDRGGIFASIVGTLELLTSAERKRVQGIIINKFRGDFSLFTDGVKWIEEKTGIPVLGVLPYVNDHMIDREDSLSINEFRRMKKTGDLELAVIQLPYASNISDVEPFYMKRMYTCVLCGMVLNLATQMRSSFPGTKSTIRDLQFMKKAGISEQIISFARDGGFVTGICGGYQMLGQRLIDEEGTDTGEKALEETGLGLMEAITYFRKEKQTIRVKGTYHSQTGMGEEKIEGYEIHLGDTIFPDAAEKRPMFLFESDREEGYYSENGRLIGTLSSSPFS